jgi:hypothetical protein
MRIEPKPFQRAAIEAAVRALTNPAGPRRFLVADEVGLGKTVVARGVVEAMAARQGRPLCVFYVCSSLVLARQNLTRIASFLPEAEQADAIATVDRPSLMPSGKLPTHPRLQLFSLSPASGLPGRGGQQGGRVEERALAAVLLERIQPGLPRRQLRNALLLRAGCDRFNALTGQYETMLDERRLGGPAFVPEFRSALRRVFNLDKGQHLPPRIMKVIDDPSRLAAKVRSALAIAALSSVRPDLVVLDEFQKFRDLLDPRTDAADEAAAHVLNAIRGGGQDGPALLLLSATPYVPYRSRAEGGGAEAVSDFFELIFFLAGNDGTTRDEVARGFATLEEELRKGAADTTRLRDIRDSLEARLRPLMCRTERSRHLAEAEPPCPERVELHPADIEAFRSFAASLHETDRQWAVPLWASVPLPLQTLGRGYHAWLHADVGTAIKGPGLTRDQRDALQPLEPAPHPRLRALLKAMPTRRLSLPWVAPSVPWWPLCGIWAGAGGRVDAKLLVFTRYRAAPGAIAGLLSFAVETTRPGRRARWKGGWESATTRSLLPASPERPALLALFHPSPLLARLDPLRARRTSELALRQGMAAQLRGILRQHGVAVVQRGRAGRSRPSWQLLAALEARTGLWPTSETAWRRVTTELRTEEGAGSRLDEMVQRWREAALAADTATISDDELRDLADLALEAPGVVLARAAHRHWAEALGPGLGAIASLSWRGLRAYLDKPWFASALSEGRAESYPDALRLAVRDGNLEAVLDEHLWYLGQSGLGDWPSRLADLSRALRLRTGNTSLHEGSTETFRLRSHAAAAMTEAKGAAGDPVEEAQLRPEEVRNAFNTPFWPHVLVTTSIGQEGLDFHPWCRAVAHWDLPAGPVALEQREGRVTRHAGLAVRRAIGSRRDKPAFVPGESPWVTLARHAEEASAAEPTGLSPWWTAEGAEVQRLLLSVPGSEVERRMLALSRERAVYRLALGMPDQADLIALLLSRGQDSTLDPAEFCLDLAALSRRSLRVHDRS